MSTAALFVEAVDTIRTLGWALAVWIVLMAIVAGLVVYALVVIAWATVRGVWRACAWLRARLAAELPPRAPEEPRDAHNAPQSRVPSWATTQPLDCEEAA